MRLKSLEKLPFAPVVGAMFGLVAAILVAATPGWLFERLVVSSGLPELVSAAQPPLGDKARILAALVALLGVGAFLATFIASIEFFLSSDRRQGNARGSRIDNVEADEEPASAPPFEEGGRRPLFAESDLGAPFMSDEAIAHARDELVLDSALPDLDEGPVPAEAAAETIVEAQWEPVAEDVAEPVEQAAERVAEPLENGAAEATPFLEDAMSAPPAEVQAASYPDADDQSVAVLLDRLEKALVRRERRTGSAAPFPSDLSALRDALVGSESRH